ncbi:MAG: hypothetical protein J6Y02_24105 [Pseudobutyrivibrio sp.]|nr:hypothetical protein [Pseudobutyrivibrio sp.]
MNSPSIDIPTIRAGATEDGRGFVTFFGDKPVYRSFEYNPGYDTFYWLNQALESGLVRLPD